MSSPESTAEQFIQLFKQQLQPDLLKGIPEELFQPGRETDLQKRIVEIVDTRLIRDKVPIGRKLRILFIESLLADIAKARNERLGLN